MTSEHDCVLSNLATAREDFGHGSRTESSSMPRRRGSQTAEGYHQEFSLPRADGGKNAWLMLAGAFLIEAFVWGFPFSFGIFQEYYTTHEPFASEPSGIAIIGTSATGIMYLSGPLVFALYRRWPQHRRTSAYIGLPIIAASLIAFSFATRVSELILAQGVAYGLGGILLYYSVLLFLEEWFVRRKGLAYGIMWAGTGVSGVTVPFIMSFGLERFGASVMLRAWAVSLVVLSAPLLYFVKPRLPIPRDSRARRFNLGFLASRTFWVFQAASIIQGLGYFIPTIYLPSYASSLGLEPNTGTIAIALVNAASVIGNIAVGSLIDKLQVSTVIGFVSVVAAFSAFVIWGVAVSTPTLAVFSLLYGMSAGGFSTTWTGVIAEVQKREISADTGMLFGFLSASRGVGAVVSGPLSEALINLRAWQGTAGLGYGTAYGSLIAFTGLTAAAGGSSWLARSVGWI